MKTTLSVSPGRAAPWGVSIIIGADEAESLPAWDELLALSGERYECGYGTVYSIYLGDFETMYDAYAFVISNGLPDPLDGLNSQYVTNPRIELEYIDKIRRRPGVKKPGRAVKKHCAQLSMDFEEQK